MSGIYGILGLNAGDNERDFVKKIGQDVVYDALGFLVQEHNAEVNEALAVWVESETETHKERYKLPGGGRLQKRGSHGAPGVVKASGSYDTAYPLEDWAAGIGWTRRGFAYMSMQDLDNHIDTVVNQNWNTVRFELLRRLFKNTTDTFVDPIYGSLTIQPLANGDAVLYPPVTGSETEAIEDHYLESGYAATAIADGSNPYITVRDDLTHHFGKAQGGTNIAVFINSAETPETEDLSDFNEVDDIFTDAGDDAARLSGLPTALPGRVVGRTNGVWVVEWDWMPSGYMIATDLDERPPLKMRVDETDTGLARGLHLASEHEHAPLSKQEWTHVFGFGAGMRLNSVVMELGTGGSYTIPTVYQ